MRHAFRCQKSLPGLLQHHSGAKGPTVFIHFLRLVGQSASCHTRATTGTGVVDILGKKKTTTPGTPSSLHPLQSQPGSQCLAKSHGAAHTRTHKFRTRLHSKHVTLLSRTAWEELAWHGERVGLTRGWLNAAAVTTPARSP